MSLEPMAGMRFHLARALYRSAVGSVSDAISDFDRAVALSEECGDYVGEITLRAELAGYVAEHGLAADAVRLSQETLAMASRRGAEYLVAAGHMCLATGYYRLGEHALARKHGTEAIELSERLQIPRMTAVARFYVARASFAMGAFEEVERLARLATEALESVPGGWCAPVQAILARSLIELDAPEEAERYARSALDASQRVTQASVFDPFVKAFAAEVLWARGDRDGSRAVIASARDQVMRRAEQIRDAEHRQRFLALDENARVLQLAGEGR
jgi:tetratricopeptide (TPR) repeat protein